MTHAKRKKIIIKEAKQEFKGDDEPNKGDDEPNRRNLQKELNSSSHGREEKSSAERKTAIRGCSLAIIFVMELNDRLAKNQFLFFINSCNDKFFSSLYHIPS